MSILRIGAIASVLLSGVAELRGEESAPLRLQVVQKEAGCKPVFTLNGKPFYPRVYSEHFAAIAPDFVAKLRSQGFNTLQICLDTEESQDERLKALLATCHAEQVPVILELNTWGMRQVLISRPELNMIQADGTLVKYFPDYANPATIKEQLSRYIQASKDVRRYIGRPVVAISVGAYDWYHLPDAEVHDDFVVPKHLRKNQTYLPYGPHVEKAFAEFSQLRGVQADGGKIKLPTSADDAVNDKDWNLWLLFRRHLVRNWLANTTVVVRKRTQVPVGVSIDLNFALHEQFATPPYAFSGVIDFASVYCYGPSPDAEYVAPLMRTFYHESLTAGMPILGFLEFSSGLAGKTRAEIYAKQCAPFSAGLMTASPQPDRAHDQGRVDAFVEWSRRNEATDLMRKEPKRADVLLVVNRNTVELGEAARLTCIGKGLTVDVMYVSPDWAGNGSEAYEIAILADGISAPQRDGLLVIPAQELETELDTLNRN